MFVVRIWIVPAAVGIVVALALTACASVTQSATPSIEPSDSAHSATVASPTPTVDPLAISADGIGPIRIGQPVSADAAAQTSIVFNPHHCGVDGANYPDWESTNPDDPAFTLAISGETQSSPVSDLEVISHALRTSAGIHLGSRLAALKAAYPDAVVIPAAVSDLYVERGRSGQIVFEVADSDYQGDSAGGLPGTVIFITIRSPGETPSGLADSDVAVGGCA
jgi:hypothetical protein